MHKGEIAFRVVQIIVALAMAFYLMHVPTMPTSEPVVSIIEVRIE